MATTNFVQVNPGAANQENDSTYQANSLTTGGVGIDAVLPSAWLNKLFFQPSTFIAAFCAMLVVKGYSTSDANISTLETVLGNVVTEADLATIISEIATLTAFMNDFVASFGTNGYIKIPVAAGGNPLIIQWGTTGNLGSGNTPVTESFNIAFSTACYGVLAIDNSVRVTSGNVSPIGALVVNTSQFDVNAQASNVTAFWVAVGR